MNFTKEQREKFKEEFKEEPLIFRDDRLLQLIEDVEELEKELAASRDSRILSAVPSANCNDLIKQTAEMFNLFKEENIGRYELTQARVALFKARNYLEEFERRRGIAG